MFHVGSLIFTLFWSRTLIYCSLVLLGWIVSPSKFLYEYLQM
jgi:hypothetical protein